MNWKGASPYRCSALWTCETHTEQLLCAIFKLQLGEEIKSTWIFLVGERTRGLQFNADSVILGTRWLLATGLYIPGALTHTLSHKKPTQVLSYLQHNALDVSPALHQIYLSVDHLQSSNLHAQNPKRRPNARLQDATKQTKRRFAYVPLSAEYSFYPDTPTSSCLGYYSLEFKK